MPASLPVPPVILPTSVAVELSGYVLDHVGVAR
jgi:hypothetical protein